MGAHHDLGQRRQGHHPPRSSSFDTRALRVSRHRAAAARVRRRLRAALPDSGSIRFTKTIGLGVSTVHRLKRELLRRAG